MLTSFQRIQNFRENYKIALIIFLYIKTLLKLTQNINYIQISDFKYKNKRLWSNWLVFQF